MLRDLRKKIIKSKVLRGLKDAIVDEFVAEHGVEYLLSLGIMKKVDNANLYYVTDSMYKNVLFNIEGEYVGHRFDTLNYREFEKGVTNPFTNGYQLLYRYEDFVEVRGIDEINTTYRSVFVVDEDGCEIIPAGKYIDFFAYKNGLVFSSRSHIKPRTNAMLITFDGRMRETDYKVIAELDPYSMHIDGEYYFKAGLLEEDKNRLRIGVVKINQDSNIETRVPHEYKCIYEPKTTCVGGTFVGQGLCDAEDFIGYMHTIDYVTGDITDIKSK